MDNEKGFVPVNPDVFNYQEFKESLVDNESSDDDSYFGSYISPVFGKISRVKPKFKDDIVVEDLQGYPVAKFVKLVDGHLKTESFSYLDYVNSQAKKIQAIVDARLQAVMLGDKSNG